MDPPSRMKIGFTAESEDAGDADPSLGSVLWCCGSDLARMGNEAGSSEVVAADLASVEEVGTVAVGWEARFPPADRPAEDVVVEVMTRSTCEARLSDESWRRSPGPGCGFGTGVARPVAC